MNAPFAAKSDAKVEHLLIYKYSSNSSIPVYAGSVIYSVKKSFEIE